MNSGKATLSGCFISDFVHSLLYTFLIAYSLSTSVVSESAVQSIEWSCKWFRLC